MNTQHQNIVRRAKLWLFYSCEMEHLSMLSPNLNIQPPTSGEEWTCCTPWMASVTGTPLLACEVLCNTSRWNRMTQKTQKKQAPVNRHFYGEECQAELALKKRGWPVGYQGTAREPIMPVRTTKWKCFKPFCKTTLYTGIKVCHVPCIKYWPKLFWCLKQNWHWLNRAQPFSHNSCLFPWDVQETFLVDCAQWVRSASLSICHP